MGYSNPSPATNVMECTLRSQSRQGIKGHGRGIGVLHRVVLKTSRVLSPMSCSQSLCQACRLLEMRYRLLAIWEFRPLLRRSALREYDSLPNSNRARDSRLRRRGVFAIRVIFSQTTAISTTHRPRHCRRGAPYTRVPHFRPPPKARAQG